MTPERLAEIDAHRLTEWLRSSPRKPAALAFTSGDERQVADLIEAAERDAVRKVVERLRLRAAAYRVSGNDLDGITIDEVADLIEQENAHG